MSRELSSEGGFRNRGRRQQGEISRCSSPAVYGTSPLRKSRNRPGEVCGWAKNCPRRLIDWFGLDVDRAIPPKDRSRRIRSL
jgi:hypothetical protein